MSLIITGTTSTAGITLASANNPVFITPGAYVFGTTSTALYGGTAGAWTLTNSGQLNAVAFGVSLKSGGIITNKATGGIIGATDGIYAAGSNSIALTVSNAGYIRGSNTINGYGIKGNKSGLVVSNQATGTIIGGYGGIYIPSGGGVGSLTNAGAINGIKFSGVAFNGGGGVTNVSGGTISGQAGVVINTTAGTVFNAGIILGKVFQGVLFGSGGTVTNAAGGAISGAQNGVQISNAAGTITNAGSIRGGSGKGVMLDRGGVVINQAAGAISESATGIASYGGTALSVSNAGNINSDNWGIFIASFSGFAGSLTNLGVVQGKLNAAVYFGNGGVVTNAGAGTIVGGSYGVEIGVATGSVWNAGLIQGKAIGVHFNSGNSGVITNAPGGTISGGTSGVRVDAYNSTVVNAGSISGTGAAGVFLSGGAVTNLSGGTITAGGYGLDFVGLIFRNGTVTNAGLIAGSSGAVSLDSGGVNRVIVDPGGSFSGVVNGGNAIGAAAVSTLELAASGALQGQIAGLGSQFINFAQVVVDSAANWTLAGTNTLTSGVTLTNSGLLTLFNGALSDAGSVVNNGTIVDEGGLTLTGALSGAGQMLIGANSTLIATGAVRASQTFAFAGGGGLLDLNPASFSGVIQGFESGDAIELAGVSNATSASVVNGNTLTVARSVGGPISLTLAPNQVYSNLIFAVEAPGGAFGANDFIAVTGPTGPTIVDGGLSMSLTGAQASTFAATNGGLGGITVTGANSTLTTTASTFVVGAASVGTLSVSAAGAVVSFAGATVAESGGSDGSSITVAGGNSNLQNSGSLNIGFAAAGSLSVVAGGTISAASLDLGVQASGSGIVSVSGANSTLTVTGNVNVGDAGVGQFSLLGGSKATVGNNLNVGETAGGAGNVDIEGASTLSVHGDLNAGDGGGAGVITVGLGGALNVAGGLTGPGIINLYGALDPKFTNGFTFNITPTATQPQQFTAYVANATFNIAQGATETLETPTIYGSTSLNIGKASDTQASKLVLDTDNVASTVSVTFGNAFGTLELGSDKLASIDTPATGTGPFTSISNPNFGDYLIGGFASTAFAGTIKNFVIGDTIIVDTASPATFAYTGGASFVSVVANAVTIGTLTFDNATNAALAFSTPNALIDQVPCFVRGTKISTSRGEIAVEDLAIGDLVVTVSGALRPIVWIGHRQIEPSRHPDPRGVRPVRVSANAFGAGLPVCDLWLSPGHNVACEGALMPISALVNGQSIQQIKQRSVEYWHIELDAHDILFAEGLPAESYLDTGNRTSFANGGAFIEAHPDFAPRHWAETCLPLVFEGPEVETTKARLIGRLFEQGFALTEDAETQLLADGCAIEPIWLSATRIMFVAPERAESIALRSRVFVPAHATPGSTDVRELGVCVKRLQIDGVEIGLDRDETLGPGWSEAEYEQGVFAWRWTEGEAQLTPSARVVVLDLAGRGLYWRASKAAVASQLGSALA